MTGLQPPLDGSVFVLTLTYTAPLDRIDALLPAHRRWLDGHYAAGTFLASGPRIPRDGGVILARGRSRTDLAALVRDDPPCRGAACTPDLGNDRLRGVAVASAVKRLSQSDVPRDSQGRPKPWWPKVPPGRSPGTPWSPMSTPWTVATASRDSMTRAAMPAAAASRRLRRGSRVGAVARM